MKTTFAILVILFLVRAHGAVFFTDRDEPIEREGVIIFHRPPDPYYFLQGDDGVAWRVNEASGKFRLQVGDRVRVTGISPRGTATPRIERAVSARLGAGVVPAVRTMTIDGLYALDPDGEAGRRDWYGHLLRVEGRVLDVNRRETYAQVLLGSKDRSVLVPVPLKWGEPLPDGLELGAWVEVTGVGVYSALPDDHRGPVTELENFCVLPATAGAVVVLDTTPFWTPVRLWFLIGGILLSATLLVFWAKGYEKAKAEAVQRERLRLSRDLHDGFQQLLAGTMFRLEAAMNFLPDDAVEVREQLEKVSDSLYHTQTGLRAALWSMTEESEGPQNLSGLVRYAAGRLAHWDGVVHFDFRGEERHVPSQVSGAVLMILHEAVGNALRHGGATKVDVAFSFRPRELVLAVRDNGCGFAGGAEMLVSRKGGGMGLRSMRDRAMALKGSVAITSEEGHGTIVVVRLPYGGAK